MSARDELDRRLAAWMTDSASATPPAGRFERAMATTARRRPRPSWLARFGSDWVGTAAPRQVEWVWPGRRRDRVAAALAVLVALAVAGVSLFGRPDGRGPSVGGPSTTQTDGPSATPRPASTSGALAPGAYSLTAPYDPLSPSPFARDAIRNCDRGCADYHRAVVFTVPVGWSFNDGLVSKHLGRADEVTFSAWTVDQVYADPCHWQGSALSPLDLANHSHDAAGAIIVAPELGGLANQALRGPRPRPLIPATVGGVQALRVELSVPADLDISTCDKGQFRSWTEWGVADGANSHAAPGQFDTVYMVDLDRRPLVIDVSHMPATSVADLAELQAIIASMVIDRDPGLPTLPAPTAIASAVLRGPGGATEVPGSVLPPGKYEWDDVDGQGFNVAFTVPAGWTWTGRSIVKGGIQGGVQDSDPGAIYFFGGPVHVYADPCHWTGEAPTPPPNATAADIMAALAAQPGRALTTPVDRPLAAPGAIGRWPGMSVALYVPSDIDINGCDAGQYRSWGPDDIARSNEGSGQRDVVWAVDIGPQPGGLIVDAASFANTPGRVLSEIDAILGSIEAGHWG